MKHTFGMTLLLLGFFLFAQIIGLHIVSQYVDIQQTAETGTTVVYQDQYIVQPPKVQNESYSWIWIVAAVLVGTLLILLLIKYKLVKFWKLWFTASVFLALLIALYPYAGKIAGILNAPEFGIILAILVVSLLTYKKIWRPDPITHNITEILMYGGIAALFDFQTACAS
jgi:hypothetical protein